MLNIKKISSIDEKFSENLKKHISQRKVSSSDIKEKVKNIIYDVKENGDKALVKFSKKYDNYDINDAKELEVKKEKFSQAIKKISKDELKALQFAKNRIEEFAFHQKSKSWDYSSEGITLGEKITPIDTNGAGDMFAGSFMHAYLEDNDLKTCAEFSNFASSKIVETFGPRLSADGYAEVANKLRKS